MRLWAILEPIKRGLGRRRRFPRRAQQLTGVDERGAVASYAETDIRGVGIRAHARGEHGEMSVARELRKDLLRVIRSLLTAA